MVGFILKDLREELIQTSLYAAVRAVQYGIPQSNYLSFHAGALQSENVHILYPNQRDRVYSI